MSTRTLATLATEILSEFGWGKRTDGTRYWSRNEFPKNDDWITDLCRDAHGDMFPDDWRYGFIHDALASVQEFDERSADDWLDEMHEAVDGCVDVYNSELCRWLGSHAYRSGYVDDATAELGQPGSTMQALMMGQYAERTEVFASVLHSLSERLDDTEG